MLRQPARPSGKRVAYPHASLLGVGPLCLVLGLPGLVLAGELWLREAPLKQHQDRVTRTIEATVDHVLNSAHGLQEDCDLHFSLLSDDIRVPFVGEIKNACSIPPDKPLTYWAKQVRDLGNQPVEVMGVLRIWPEHAPKETQSEATPAKPSKNANPPHQVELHPVLQIGSLDVRANVTRIRKVSEDFTRYVYGEDTLRQIARKTVEVQRLDLAGESYVRIKAPATPYNHWRLKAVVKEEPIVLQDGVSLTFDILKANVPGSHAAPEIPTVSAVAAFGTAVYDKAANLHSGNVTRFWALIRLHVPTLLKATATPTTIPLPLEFVLLDLELEQ